MATRGSEQRGRLFDRLLQGYALVDPRNAGTIPCPICLRRFTREQALVGELTLEHVPPAAVGGKPVVLTCRSCNSGAGAGIDAALAARTRITSFAQQRPVTLKAVMTVEGVKQRVTIDADGDAVQILGAERAGHPDVAGKMIAAFERGVSASDEVLEFNLELEDRFLPREADLSMLRAGYLLALDRLGWRYALSEALTPVRQQLLSVDTEMITPPVVVDPKAPPEEVRLLLVKQPTELRSVSILVAQHHVFLPPPGHTRDFFVDIIPVLANTFDGSTVEFHGIVVEDVAPRFLLDHHPEVADRLRDA